MRSPRFSCQKISVFRERRLPEAAYLVGYSALINTYQLSVPLPRRLMAIATQHKEVTTGHWQLLGPRYQPSDTLEGHLVFALKYEGLALGVLKNLFQLVSPGEIENLVRNTPTGKYARRIWFLYEWLNGTLLGLPDIGRGSYVHVVDESLQYGTTGSNVPRQRVVNNLPGTPEFCPLVFRTEKLDTLIAQDLASHAIEIIARVPADILARAAAFLLLKDTRSSYAIEGEQPTHDRIQRWGRAVSQAGETTLDLTELLRLHDIVIGDARFVKMGLRKDDGFIGEHDRYTRYPIPVHISARSDDLPQLMQGLIQFAQTHARDLDPVIAAAVLAFGFVYIHPFQDGNGRLHRYLIHHILSERRFHPPGIIFPISATILARLDDYRKVLESYSREVLPLIEWKATPDNNVQVLNDTSDLYKYFDATPHAEFLYECVYTTINEELPKEAEFLKNYDQFCERVNTIVDMPSRTLDLLFRFLEQNSGKLSKRAKNGEFSALKESEVHAIESAYIDIFRAKI